MQLLEDFNFYSECKNTLIESFGNLEIAKAKIKRGKYSEVEDHIIEENLVIIKESLGGKILNFVSKNLGGDISKIDSILSKMKEEETKFIHEENESESKYYKLTSTLAQLRRDKAPETDKAVITDSLRKIEKYLRDIVKSHSSIMDDLEKQINIITKKSKRKTEYYNLKRAEDSVETKKLRAEFKKKLIKDLQDDSDMKGLYSIIGTSEQASKEYEKAQEEKKKASENLGNKENKDNEESQSEKPEEIDIDEMKNTIDEKAKSISKYVEEKYKTLSAGRLRGGAFNTSFNNFHGKVNDLYKTVDSYFSKTSKGSKEYTTLKNIKVIANNIVYLEEKGKDDSKLKKIIDDVNKISSELKNI